MVRGYRLPLPVHLLLIRGSIIWHVGQLPRIPSFLTLAISDWRTWTLDIPEMTFLRSAGHCLASEIFAGLGNSATAATRRWVAASSTCNLSGSHQTRALESLLDRGLLNKLLELQHPDPRTTPNTSVTVPALQARGSWRRMHVTTPGGVGERQNPASFIWHSKPIYF